VPALREAARLAAAIRCDLLLGGVQAGRVSGFEPPRPHRATMLDMEAELSWAGEYVGVVILNEDGVTVSLVDPAHQEQVEREFREAGPVEHAPGNREGEVRWLDFSNFGGRRWFEKVLRRLDTLGYTWEETKTDTS
jgi:hypothetical protein